MPALRDVSGEQAKRAFEKAGWYLRKTATKPKGSHIWILKKDGVPNLITIPNKQRLGIGLLTKFLRVAQMSREEFESLLP